MSKITRQPLTLFGGSGGSSNFGQFGSQAASAPVETKDVPTIQALTAWVNGWQSAVALGQAPYLQDMNALFYVLCYELCYALQEGVVAWDSTTSYYIGSVVKKDGTFELYGSIVNDNLGNALPSQVTNANWKYLGLLTDLVQVPYAPQNVEVNGGREIWQRGTTFNSIANGAYSADRCKMFFDSSPTVNVTREATTIHSGTYSSKIVVGAISSATKIYEHQPLPNFADYRGLYISRSVWVNTTLTNVKVGLYDGTTLAKSSAHPGDGAWHQLTVSLLVSGSASQLDLQVGQLDGTIATGTWYVDDCMTTLGPVPNQFNPEDPCKALERCQYFYETGLFETIDILVRRTTTPTTRIANKIHFNTPKRVQATMSYTLNVAVLWVLAAVGVVSDPATDTTNWATPTDAGSATTQSNSFYIQRNSDYGGPAGALGYQFTWTATADN